jgi:hypothetical protein
VGGFFAARPVVIGDNNEYLSPVVDMDHRYPDPGEDFNDRGGTWDYTAWWKWTPNKTGTALIGLPGSDQSAHPELFLYAGVSVYVAPADGGMPHDADAVPGAAYLDTILDYGIEVVAGTTYYIRVYAAHWWFEVDRENDNPIPGAKPIRLRIRFGGTANDELDNAYPVTIGADDPQYISQRQDLSANLLAPGEFTLTGTETGPRGQQTPAQDVWNRTAWWTYLPAYDGMVTISTALSSPTAATANVYRARADGGIPQQSDLVLYDVGNVGGTSEFAAVGGVTYLIQLITAGPNPPGFGATIGPSPAQFTLTGPRSAEDNLVGPLFALRRGRIAGKPAHWDTISIGQSPPAGPGLLHLKMPDKSWVHHVDLRMSDATPLLLLTSGGWAFTCWLSPGKGTLPGTAIIEWNSDDLLQLPFLQQLRTGYDLTRWPTAVAVNEIIETSWIANAHQVPWIGFSDRGNFKADPDATAFERQDFGIGWTTVDLNLIRRFLPPGTIVERATIVFTVELKALATPEDHPETFPFGDLHARIYDVTADVPTTQRMVDTQFKRLDLSVPITVNGAGTTFVTGGGVLAGHTVAATVSFGATEYTPASMWTKQGTATATREISSYEFANVDHLDFAIECDNVGKPPAHVVVENSDTGSISRHINATGHWKVVLQGTLPEGI